MDESEQCRCVSLTWRESTGHGLNRRVCQRVVAVARHVVAWHGVRAVAVAAAPAQWRRTRTERERHVGVVHMASGAAGARRQVYRKLE